MKMKEYRVWRKWRKEKELLYLRREENAFLQKSSDEDPEQRKPVLSTESESQKQQRATANDSQRVTLLVSEFRCSPNGMTALGLRISRLNCSSFLLLFYYPSIPTLGSSQSWWEMGVSENRPKGSHPTGEPEAAKPLKQGKWRLTGLESFFILRKSEGEKQNDD